MAIACKESPLGARALSGCIIGAANAGKSSLINALVNKTISAVSNKASTTDETAMAAFTDLETNTQVTFLDTPGVVKASNSMKSSLLVSKAWSAIEEVDQVIFVVDAAKRLSFEVREALVRLNKISKDIDP